MKSLLKQLVVLFIGILILSLATCAPVPNQSPTSEVTNIPTVTSGISITDIALANSEWTLISFIEAGIVTPVIQGSNTKVL
jgi:hypothetical protein